MIFLIISNEPSLQNTIKKYIREEYRDAKFLEIYYKKQFDDAIKKDFDVVITDYILDWSNGIRVLIEIRKRKPFAPVIMLIDEDMEEVAIEAMKMGLDDYILKKPSEFKKLPAIVKVAIEKESIREKKEMLSLIVESADEAVVSIDAKGRIIYANKAIEKIFGWKVEELIGKNFGIFATDKERKQFEEAIKKGGVRIETVRKDRYGNEVPVLMTVIPFKDKTGNLLFSTVIIVDIRELKEYEKRIKHLNDVLKAIRNINQLITKEKDIDKLLQGICDILVKVRKYESVCILVEEKIFLAGGKEKCRKLIEFINKTREKLEKKREIIEKINGNYVFGMCFSNEVCNSLYVLHSEKFDKEEMDLLREICGDIGFAIHSIKIQENLREEEELMKAILSASPVGIGYTINRILGWANDAMYKMTGYTPEETLGKSARILYESDEEYERVGREIEKAIREGRIAEIETRWKRKDGSVFDCYLRVYPINPKKPTELVVVAMDVTERKRLIKALEEREKRFRSLFENATVGIYRTTPDGKILMINPFLAKLLGYKDEKEILMKNLNKRKEYEPTYDRREFIREIEEKGYFMREAPWKRKDGKILWIRETAIAIKDEKGRTLYYDGVIEDITELKKKEEELIKSKEEWKAIFTSISDPVVILSKDYTIIDANPAALRTIGFDKKEIIGKKCYEIFHSRKEIIKNCPMKKLLRNNKPVTETVEMDKLNGVYLVSVSPIFEEGRIKRVVYHAKDITKLKQLMEELAESEEKYRMLADNAPAGVFIVYKEEVIYLNKRAEEMLKREENAKHLYDIWKNSGRIPINAFFDIWKKKRRREKVINVFEKTLKEEGVHTIELKTTGKRYLLFQIVNIKYKGDKALLGIVEDITELREAEKKLRESEAKFRSLVENAGDAIYIITHEGFEYVNPAFEKLTGYKRNEILSKDFNFWELIHPDDRKLIEKRRDARKKGREITSRYEFRIVTKNGRIKYVDASTVPLGGKRVLGILRDVTERKKAEELISKLSELHYIIGMSINRSNTIKELCHNILKNIKEIIGVDYTNIFIYDKERNVLKPVIYYGYPEEFIKRVLKEYKISDDSPWEAVKTFLQKKERYVKDLKKYKPLSFNWDLYKKYDATELYSIPLITENKVYGILQVLNTSKNPLTDEKKKLLKSIAEEIAAGIVKIEAQEKMRKALEKEREFKLKTAHYFFNPICIAKGYLELALEEKDGKDKIVKAMEAIRRIEKVVKNVTQRGEITE